MARKFHLQPRRSSPGGGGRDRVWVLLHQGLLGQDLGRRDRQGAGNAPGICVGRGGQGVQPGRRSAHDPRGSGRSWQARGAAEAADYRVKVWDVATGKNLSSSDIHTGPLYNSAFSGDGGRLATWSRDGKIKIRDATTGKELTSFEGRTRPFALAFSPDGRRLASGGRDGTLIVWDVSNGREILSIRGHPASVGRDSFIGRVAFSPDGLRLATASSDRTVKVWDAATGRELLTLKGHAGWVDGVAFSPDGQRIASGGRDGMVRLWDAMTGKEVSTLYGYSGSDLIHLFQPRRPAAGGQREQGRLRQNLGGERPSGNSGEPRGRSDRGRPFPSARPPRRRPGAAGDSAGA